MKQKTTQTRSRWILVCLLSLLMILSGSSPAWADEITVSDGSATNYNLPVYGYYVDSFGSSEFIIPSSQLTALNGITINKMMFYLGTPAEASWGAASFNIYLEEVSGSNYDDDSSSQLTESKTLVYAGALDGTGSTMEIPFSTNYTYNGGNLLVAVEVGTKGTYSSAIFYGTTTTSYSGRYKYGSSSASRAKFIPKTTFVTPTVGPGFAVKDGSTKLSSPYAYNFGLATAGTAKTFTLTNPGTAATPIALSTTGNVGASIGEATSIAAGGEVTLTLTMPDADASGTVTVTPTGDGLNPFVFNVSGTKRNANKVYETLLTGSIPEDWTTSGGTWSWSTTNGASNTAWYESSNYRLITPKLTIAEGEKFFFDAQGTYSGYQGVIFEYSSDGTTWTASSTTTTVNSEWQTFQINDIPAGKYYIAIHGWHVNVRNFYGGELPNEPKMVVTQPATLDFGLYDKDADPAPTKTFTIANTGKATLSGISVSSANAAFTITGAPTSLAAGADAEVTITMSTATAGALSSLITVSATDMADASFTVKGTVKPAGMPVEEFTDGLPANWTNASWTFANGEATGKSSSAYLTTPKLSFSAGDFIIIKAKRFDSDTSDYLTVQGSNDNGSTWTAYSKKLQNADGLTYPDYGTMVLTDIPANVNKLRFVGYYCVVDEIHGLNYAPVLAVTKDETPVSSPAAYDFGEQAANASVTYNFANAGAGTLSVTNVVVTNDPADGTYTTNWTESVATPFNLVITQNYDAEKAGAKTGSVVVTMSDASTFTINLSGTLLAANAPTLSVSTNAIDFGKVTANAVQTVTVTNTGTGTMAVDIASDSEDFEVSTASLTGIGAGLSKTFNITFKYGTPYGVKNGNVTVTPTYNAEAAQVITVTGKAKDPAIWSEDFSGGTLPTGWDAGANWTIEDGKAKATYEYGVTNYLTTAPLTVSGTTDELTFDYEVTGTYVTITIQQSKDGGAWETCTATPTLNSLDNGAAGTATITGLEAGTYQFRFANDGYNLDNFEGFVLNLPDHMMAITASSIPSSGLKEGQAFNATVDVKENRGVAETGVIAKLYMNSVVIGTSTATDFEANESKQITIPCTPTTGADDASMYIEVVYASGSETVSTTPVNRNVAAITNLTLDETSDDELVNNTYDNIILKRKFTKGWNTVCLPFTISDIEAFFGVGAKAYNLTSYSDGVLGFENVDELEATYPYVVYVPAAITEDIIINNINITINYGNRTADSRHIGDAYFRGTYVPIAAGSWPAGAYGVTSDGKIAPGTSTSFMKGFRAYFTGITAGARLSFFDETTGITTVIDAKELNNDGKVYNLNGQRVENAHKGLYIVNGRKVVVK